MSVSCPFRANRSVTLIRMNTADLLSSIDSEISLFQQVRALLAGEVPSVRRVAKPAKKHHTLSAEARERIAAAQRKRWAAQKKTAKKSP